MKYKQHPHPDHPLSDTLPTNPAMIGYATDDASLIYALMPLMMHLLSMLICTPNLPL